MKTLTIGTKFTAPVDAPYSAGQEVTISGFDSGQIIVDTNDGEQLLVSPSAALAAMHATEAPTKADMTTIFRIQHKRDGMGCYSRADADKERGMEDVVGSTISSPRHPTMTQDSLLWRNVQAMGVSNFDLMMGTPMQDYCFGFASIEQLRAWMYKDEWLAGLADQNYVLASCKVPRSDVIEGNAQVLFIRPAKYKKTDLRKAFDLK